MVMLGANADGHAASIQSPPKVSGDQVGKVAAVVEVEHWAWRVAAYARDWKDKVMRIAKLKKFCLEWRKFLTVWKGRRVGQPVPKSMLPDLSVSVLEYLQAENLLIKIDSGKTFFAGNFEKEECN